MNCDALLDLLIQVRNSIIESEGFCSRQFRTKDEAIYYFNEIISGLHFESNTSIDSVTYAFGDEGYLKEIAASGSWSAEYEKMNKEFGKIIRAIRSEQKQERRSVADANRTNAGYNATSPSRFIISDAKWDFILAIFGVGFFQKRRINKKREAVQNEIGIGEINPAMVITTEPLVVAAYSYHLDAVVLLSFPQEFVQKYSLNQYDRLISINTRNRESEHFDAFKSDMHPTWMDVNPSIADFLLDDTNMLLAHKNIVPYSAWQYVKFLGMECLKKHKGRMREGFWFIDAKIPETIEY